jgi:hypothetical protein
MDRLKDLLKQAEAAAPLEGWDPPYCGDIDLAIARDGTWHYRGSAVARPALTKLFARILRCEPDGRYYLVSPVEKVDVAVADAPFVAVELEASGRGRDQSLLFRTNVDDVVACGPSHPLRFALAAPGDGLKPYVHVRGRLEALVTRALVYELAELAAAGPDGVSQGIWSGGVFFAFPE